MKKILAILVLISLVFSGCTSAKQESLAEDDNDIVNKATSTPDSTQDEVNSTTTPTPTITLSETKSSDEDDFPTPLPTIRTVPSDKTIDVEGTDEVYRYFSIPLDVNRYYDGDEIYHVDNTYKYTIKYPNEWLDIVEYRGFADSYSAIQEMVIDFDGYYDYDNEIIIKSTMFPTDFILFDELADEYIQTYDGHVIGIYYNENSSSKVDFKFNIKDYKNLQGRVLMQKSLYNKNKAKVFEMLKSINIQEIYDESEYSTGQIDDLNIEFRIPYYWKDELRGSEKDDDGKVKAASLWITLGYPSEAYPNYMWVNIKYDEEIDVSEYDDLVAYTNDELPIKFKIDIQGDYGLRYEFIIEELQIDGSVELEQTLYETYREDIINFIRSFTTIIKPELELVSEREIDEAEISKYTSRSHRINLEYPTKWQEFVDAIGGENFSIKFGDDGYPHMNYIQINNYEDYLSEWGEINLSEWEKIILDNGLFAYLKIEERETRDKETINAKIMFENSTSFLGTIYMDKDLYYEYEDEFIAIIKSIDINE